MIIIIKNFFLGVLVGFKKAYFFISFIVIKRSYYKMKKDIIDNYYKYIEDRYCSMTLDELLGKKYIVSEKFGIGSFLRMKIEDGLEIARMEFDQMEMDIDNRGYRDDVLEVAYCYSGSIKITSLPDNRKYVLKAGDICIYKMLNDLDYFKFEYENCKTISIHMYFKAIKSVISPSWEDKVIIDWQESINNIFKGNTIVIEKSSYDLKEIARQIDYISSNNVMSYMKLKLKTIEFLATFLEEKLRGDSRNLEKQESEIVSKSKEIINRNLAYPPSVKELAMKLNISVYKLQKAFKEITGNTVYKYIKKEKLEKAKYLLKNTNMSILEISIEIGYENPSKFANLFKQYNHMTPLKYRKIQNSIEEK